MANNPGSVHDKSKDLASSVGQAASDIKSKASDLGSAAMSQAKDAASSLADKAKDAASAVGHRMGDAANYVGQRGGRHGRGRRRPQVAGQPGAAERPARGHARHRRRRRRQRPRPHRRLPAEQGLSGMAGDFTNLIRRNPIPALLIGVAVGFLFARATTSRS